MSKNTYLDLDSKIKMKIATDNYTFFDKIMYGGLGYGYFCVPENIFKIIFTVIFPPLGVLIDSIKTSKKEFPYISINNFKEILGRIDKIFICFILTALFYVPGLIYALNVINTSDALNQTKFVLTGETDNTTKETKSNFTNTNETKTKNKTNPIKNNKKSDVYDVNNTFKNLDDIRKSLNL